MKKLFLIFLILMVGLVGLSAIQNRPRGGCEAPSILPLDGVQHSTAAPVTPLYVRERIQKAVVTARLYRPDNTGGMRALARETAQKVDRELWFQTSHLSLRHVENAEFLDESARVIVSWAERFLAGQLSEDEFKTGCRLPGRAEMRLLSQNASIGLIPSRFPLPC
ncbi:MAG: hypothetical protein LBQ88_11055 [Treponema sp.]|nr:hypothetical protein [Treponema sp.]